MMKNRVFDEKWAFRWKLLKKILKSFSMKIVDRRKKRRVDRSSAHCWDKSDKPLLVSVSVRTRDANFKVEI